MISLEDLKTLFSLKNKPKDIKSIEYQLLFWFENNEIITLDINEDDLTIGLCQYLDNDTYSFWINFLTIQNIDIFLQLSNSNPLILEMIKSKVQNIKLEPAKLNIMTNCITIENVLIAKIIKFLNIPLIPDQNLSNILELKTQDISLYDLTISNINNSLTLSTSSFFEDIEDYFLNTIQIAKNTITLTLLVTSINSFAGDTTQSNITNALSSSGKALTQVEEVKKILENGKKSGLKKLDNIKESDPYLEIPLTVIGYGAKALNDKGIKLKSKDLVFDSDLSYQVFIGKEVEMSILGKNPLVDKSDYKLSGSNTKIKMDVNFEIDW
jgi:hypothetical protein